MKSGLNYEGPSIEPKFDGFQKEILCSKSFEIASIKTPLNDKRSNSDSSSSSKTKENKDTKSRAASLKIEQALEKTHIKSEELFKTS